MNEGQMDNKWTNFKGKITSRWGKITDDDLEHARSNLIRVAGLIQEKYTGAKENVKNHLDPVIKKVSEKTKNMKEKM